MNVYLKEEADHRAVDYFQSVEPVPRARAPLPSYRPQSATSLKIIPFSVNSRQHFGL
jgi:hypothetical protein